MISSVPSALLAWQAVVFADRPRRVDLLRLTPDRSLQPLSVRIHRNQTVEHALSPLRTFLAYAGWDASISAGPYDDALVASHPGATADVELVWLDFDRYRDTQEPEELAAWLRRRVSALRGETDAAIVVADAPGQDPWAGRLRAETIRALGTMAGVGIAGVSAVASQLGPDFRDERARSIAASTMGDTAAIAIARLLAFVAIPPLLRPRIKVLALDLDETLYSGVLGEDGAAGVRVTAAHALLHQSIRDVAASGVLLALVSRNDPDDVRTLFRDRPDLGLQWGDFAAHALGWAPKSEGITRVAAALRVGVDAVLFVDDNPGELAEVLHALPAVHALHASDPGVVVRALALQPGLAGYRSGHEDALRAADLAAMSAREAVVARTDQKRDPAAYARELDARLVLRSDPHDLVARLSELSRKTNQMNTGLRRISEIEVTRRLNDPDFRTISFALSDRLSDAGVVGVVFCRRADDVLEVDEVAMSCRALGRGVETIAILSAVIHAAEELGVARAHFAFTAGPRNGPARDWLASLPGSALRPDIPIAELMAHAETHRNGFHPMWEAA